MARRNLWECDRCRVDLDKHPPTHNIVINKGDDWASDLCDSCARQVERLLEGESIEEPP